MHDTYILLDLGKLNRKSAFFPTAQANNTFQSNGVSQVDFVHMVTTHEFNKGY